MRSKETYQSIKQKRSLQSQASALLAKAFPKEYGKEKEKKKQPKIFYGNNY